MAATPSTPMNGGIGPHSYSQNSYFQRTGMEAAKVLIQGGIAKKLDMDDRLFNSSTESRKVFRIADLGCSVGPNTFIVVQNIVDFVKLKYQSSGLDQEALEFQVFFNDQTSNDFNTLFKSLPSNRQYFAVGVPGLFQGRLFPKDSLHFIHSSYTLHWLSSTPRELTDKDSPAYNKGRINYVNAPTAVVEAYSNKFSEDMSSFLCSRAEELVRGGLMALLIPCVPDGVPFSQCSFLLVTTLLEACVIDLVDEGLVSEATVDSFNFPKYNPTPQEVKDLIDKNACFSIEMIEPVVREPTSTRAFDLQTWVGHYRASNEGLIREHFGDEIVEELYDRLTKKAAMEFSSPSTQLTSLKHTIELFVLLKRN